MSTASELKAQVVFATITGNNEAVADIIIADLADAGVQVKKTEISQTEVEDLKGLDIIVLVPYTYDGGSLPDEGLDFFNDLAYTDLSGSIYGVAGSGDLFYDDTYCLALDAFDQELSLSKAKRGAQIVRIDLHPDSDDKVALKKFSDELIKNTLAAQ